MYKCTPAPRFCSHHVIEQVLLIGPAKGDPWYTDIFCIPSCPTTGPLKERFQKFNTGGDRGALRLGQVRSLSLSLSAFLTRQTPYLASDTTPS